MSSNLLSIPTCQSLQRSGTMARMRRGSAVAAPSFGTSRLLVISTTSSCSSSPSSSTVCTRTGSTCSRAFASESSFSRLSSKADAATVRWSPLPSPRLPRFSLSLGAAGSASSLKSAPAIPSSICASAASVSCWSSWGQSSACSERKGSSVASSASSGSASSTSSVISAFSARPSCSSHPCCSACSKIVISEAFGTRSWAKAALSQWILCRPFRSRSSCSRSKAMESPMVPAIIPADVTSAIRAAVGSSASLPNSLRAAASLTSRKVADCETKTTTVPSGSCGTPLSSTRTSATSRRSAPNSRTSRREPISSSSLKDAKVMPLSGMFVFRNRESR
mmetsp:Transcript_102587/g.244548  ORF Transcript_102587/g.244548 Transcript_102587/m.244548 type:complete len:335 (-) Transcript_102587:851-1855(-)